MFSRVGTISRNFVGSKNKNFQKSKRVRKIKIDAVVSFTENIFSLKFAWRERREPKKVANFKKNKRILFCMKLAIFYYAEQLTWNQILKQDWLSLVLYFDYISNS